MALIDRQAAAGGVGAGIGVDLIANGGDVIMSILSGIVGTVDLWLPLVSQLHALAGTIGWLPRGLLQEAMTFVSIVFVAVIAVRIVKRWRQNA